MTSMPLKRNPRLEDLRGWAGDFLQSYPKADLLLRAYCLASEVIINVLGPRWYAKHIHSEGGDKYLRSEYEHPETIEGRRDRLKHQDRVIQLGEILFNLQDVDGFQDRVQQLREGATPETAVAELEGAKHLFIKGIPFRFVEEKQKKRSDYDLELSLSIGATPCESKCKVESTRLGMKTLLDRLDDAGGQLPVDRPGLVLVKVPEEWVRQPEVAQSVNEALAAAFTRHRHIAGVLFYWEIWTDMPEQGAARATLLRAVVNQESPFSTEPLRDEILALPKRPGGRWRSFAQLLREWS